ncbi:hypothetical protein KM031_08215 [Gemmobacter fulvus]|uniref:Uncharacterized protein n=1 Tax=Gemmobacter fulvus TaxID=2840474 RepID=A0A975PB19_9RHOB|nr:DUF6525 family protein [Gemmobacter fulvus]MBT9247249.1 hypothetical protein [Gemmobacter fulvus]MDQ1849991.1 DUF6525 family protein [Gemmobacter fulvus]QWK91826.1 hypothetical protein KM031_08215 [Gemmobacter fulvus]
MSRNLVSPRARWRRGSPMARHDQLPAPLRHWLAHAALPWSLRSILPLWQKALRDTGCETAALARLSAAEAATLRRDAAQVWGTDYPAR